ncbi:MAG: MmgE/PrpD family protein, partial [Geminicoccaceae bacterium]
MSDPVDFTLSLRFEDLPASVVDDAVRALIDTSGVAVSAAQTPLSRIIRDHAAEQFGGSAAYLWQDGRKVSVAGAVLANGMTIDAVDAHDGHKLAKGHVGCGIMPAAIALAEAEGLHDARAFLTSIVVGYEIGTRAGIALHQSAADYHTSGAWIALAAAALGARAFGLDGSAAREALGIAEYHGPRSQMMRCIDHPTMVKDGSGWGAMAGVSAAYLARNGFTGAPALTMESPDLVPVWQDLGARWYIEEQYIKLYPVCRWAQPAVDAVLSLRRRHGIVAADVTGIHVESFHEARRLTALPSTSEQAQYSLPFSVAIALARGGIEVKDILDEGLADPEIRRLAGLVTIDETKDFNAAFPERRFARVALTNKGGETFRSEVTEARG